MKRYIKSFRMIFIAFIFMSLFYSLEVSKFDQTKLKFIEENDFFSYDSEMFNIDSKKVTYKNLTKELNKYKDILIKEEFLEYDKFRGSAIYFTNIPKYVPNIIEGRYFNLDDFKSNDSIAVVGKNLVEHLETENNDKYLVLDNVKYKVIGIMGGKDSAVNDKFIINLNSANLENTRISNKSFFKMELTTKKLIENLNENLRSVDKTAKTLKNSSKEIINPISGYIKSKIYYLVFFMIVFIISSINITNFYMEKRKNEIGVLKALGIKSNRIFFKILIEYEIVVFISLIIGLGIHWIFYLIVFKEQLYYSLNLFNMLIIVVLTLLIGIITCVIPLYRLLKINPIYIIKR